MKKQCENCGSEYAEDIKFCTNCGKKLEEIKEEPKTQVKSSEKTKPLKLKTPKPVDKILLPIVIISLILSIVAIALPFAIGDEEITSGSIGTPELAANSVTSSKISDGTIENDDISPFGISRIAPSAVNSENIIEGAINMVHLASEVVDAINVTDEISNESITSEKIKDYSIDSIDIKNNSITSIKIPANTIGSSEIASEAVDTGDIADDAVTYDKMVIKIKYGLKTSAFNTSLVSHGLGAVPQTVILTPVYEEDNYIIHANVYEIDDDSFRVGLWAETISTSPEISEITEITGGIDIYWLAIL